MSTADSSSVTADSGSNTADSGSPLSVIYPARILSTWCDPQRNAALAGLLPYGEFFQAPGDVLIYGIDWDGWLSNYWQRGAAVPPNTTIRAHAPTGFQFTTILGGQSGNTEPAWGTPMLGQMFLDGSVLWICESIDTTSLVATVQSAQWTVQSGIATDAQAMAGQIVIAQIDSSQSAIGQNYTINIPTTMSDGEIKTGRIVIKVR